MKRNLALIYASWGILYVGLVLIFKYLPHSGNIGFLSLIFGLVYFLLPGWLINRFIKINNLARSGQILTSFVFSLGFYLILGLSAILIGLTLESLMILVIALTAVLFLMGLIYDLKTGREYRFNLKIKDSWFLYVIPVIVSFLILLFIDSQGANYNGDPYFHLAIIRKAVEGMPLTSSNLVYSQSAQNNPAYLMPAWHLTVAVLSKFLQIDIVSAWSKINLSLLPICFLGLYFFIRTIFKNKLIVLVTFLVSLFFLFFPGLGYFFERLLVPDGFCQFILMPLALSFCLIFIFEKNQKIIWPLAILTISLIDIHAVHFLYFLLTLVLFAIIISLATLFREKEILKKAWELVILNLILVIVLAVLFELKNGAVLDALNSFWRAPVAAISYPTFSSFPAAYKIGFVLLPLTLCWARNRRTLLILSSFLLIPLIYWTGLRDLTIKLFSFIFTDRLLVNAGWYWLVFGSLFGGLFLGLELLVKQEKSKKILIFGSFLAATLVLIIESVFQTFSNLIYKIFYARPILEQGYAWAWPVFGGAIIVTAGFLIWQKKKPSSWPKIDELSLYWLMVIFLTVIVFYPTIFKADFPELKLRFFSQNNISEVSASAKDLGTAPAYALFIKNSIPEKSTILANPSVSRILPVWVDDYLVYYPGSAWSQTFGLLFEGALSEKATEDLLGDPKYKIDYIVSSPDDKIQQYLKGSSYQKIYSQNYTIYKVTK